MRSLTAIQKKQNLAGFELFIRENTEVSFLGIFGSVQEESKKILKVTFENINLATGTVRK